jgi:putative cell wall-binding protein
LSKPTTGLRRAGIASVATTALALSACVVGAGAANAVPGFAFDRINGDDRYATAQAVAEEYGDKTDVILANGETGFYADALSANVLAGELDAPILLTRDDRTPPETLQQLKDMGAENITVVGGPGVVSEEQVAALEDAGYTVTRIAGTDRFETNADVIAAGPDAKDNLGLIATGFNFADALAAGPFAYNGHPLGLTTNDDIDDAVVDALEAKGVTEVLIFGGPNAVGAEVVTELATAGITVEERFAGTDRSETSKIAAEWGLANAGFTNTGVNVASGYVQGGGADALAGGPLTGMQNRPLLITKNVENPDDVLTYLTAHNNTLTEGAIFGGTGAVSADAEAAMNEAAQGSGNASITVTPTEATTLEFVAPNPDGDTSDDRVYTVSGATAGTEYDIVLADASLVSEKNGTVTFTDAGGNTADFGTVDADITSVNGVPNTGAASITPTGTSFDFRVDGESDETIVPVVFVDADNDGELDLNDNDTPVAAEAFGVGGETNYQPGEATSGFHPLAPVTEVNKTADQIVAGDLFYYDANDEFYVGGTSIAYQVTMEEFEAQLSVGDRLMSEYSDNPTFTSEFYLDDITPEQLSAPSVEDVTDTTVTLTLDETEIADGATVTIYGDSDATADSVTTDDDVYATATKDADADTAGFQVDVTGLTPGTDYEFAATQTVDGEESTISGDVDVTTETAESTIPPTITNTVLETDAFLVGGVGEGDVIGVEFSELVQMIANGPDHATGDWADVALIDVKDEDGDLFRVRCYDPAAPGGFATPGDDITDATCAYLDDPATPTEGDTVEITLAESAEDRNVAGDAGSAGGSISYPATVSAIQNVVDSDGNKVDLENSDDLLVDSE